MAAPNPRPGVDADIVQAAFVRGYDSPLNANPAKDLVVSVGKNTATNAVSKVLLWNRTDQNHPLLVFRPGAVLAAAPAFELYAGTVANPNGVVTAPIGSLYLSNSPAALWQNLDGILAWKKISDDLGGETLAETLALGNLTGGSNIVVTSGDKIQGQDSALGPGGPLALLGGAATGAPGAGGDVLIGSGAALAGLSGKVEITTSAGNGANGSGFVRVASGDSTGGANSGNLLFQTGTAGAVGFGGNAGTISILGGLADQAGPSSSRGGSLFLRGGRGRTDNEGGSITIAAGPSSNLSPFFPILPPTAGQGGSVSISAALSAAARPGGNVFLFGGTGGPAGGAGGNIILTPGQGGGGGQDGTVQAAGLFTATNWLRGNGNPNGVVPGDEGYVYQRGDGGQGSLWVNTNGSVNGWGKLALSGSLVDALTKAQQGYIVPSGSLLAAVDEDRFSDVGLFKGIRPVFAAGGALSHGGATPEGGPLLILQFEGGAGSTAALDMSASLSQQIFALDQEFVASFKFRNTGVGIQQRMFLGYSTNDATVQLSADTPAVGSYVGLVKSGSSQNWFFVNRGPVGFNLVNTTITSILTSTAGNPFYYIIDTQDFLNGNIRHLFLDQDLNQLASFTAVGLNVVLPSSTTRLQPIIGGLNINGANPASLNLFQASVVVEADSLEGGGGNNGGNQTLEQTLQFGNFTGILPIILSQGSSILGESDGDGGHGSPLILSSGQTTALGNNTGSFTLTTANLPLAGALGNTGSAVISTGSIAGAGASGNTGLLTISTGAVTNATATGLTGDVLLSSGSSSGNGGLTGSLDLFTGQHTGVGGAIGNIRIAPGSVVAQPATPGNLIVRGGSTTLGGITGGSVSIRAGDNQSATGNTGPLNLETADAPLTGNAGQITILGGAGGAADGQGGNVLVQAGSGLGPGAGAFGGSVGILAGQGTVVGGSVIIAAGQSNTIPGAIVAISAGDSLVSTGGDIRLNPGTGPGGDGAVVVNGKLTVTGLIDPTGMLFSGQAVLPSAVAGGEGLIWVDNTVVPSRLIFTDDTGINTIVGSGGATTLASLTDVSIAAPVLGEVLTYNGAQWQNLPGSGGSPLSTILALGNATGANDIIVNTGQQLTAQTDLLLNPGGGPGDRVVLDGLRWPDSDGTPGSVLVTDGLGNLIFSPGGAAGGPTFAQALARLQAGYAVPLASGLSTLDGFGLYTPAVESHGGVFIAFTGTPIGLVSQYTTGAVLNQDAGVYDSSYCTNHPRRSLSSFKLGMPSTASPHRFFVGLSGATTAPNFFDNQLVSDNPGVIHAGIAFSSDLLDTVYRFVFDSDGASFTSAASTVAAGNFARHVEVDLTDLAQVTIRIFDINGIELDSHTFAGSLATTRDLTPTACLRTRSAGDIRFSVYSIYIINQAYLVGGFGGSGTQTLAQVLFFGNQTGGQSIKGDDNALGAGGDLTLQGGSSTGSGGSGGDLSLLGGAPDPGGNGNAGNILLVGSPGATDGNGSAIGVMAGTGIGTGSGGTIQIEAGDAEDGGPGSINLLAGAASAGDHQGGTVFVGGGAGVGLLNGGNVGLQGGNGGLGGGDGGNVTLRPGAGQGGGVDGTVLMQGNAHITGKLTVDGLIDPPGLLMTPSVSAPFAPAPGEGGVWINLLGELIYTNDGGDLNLSDLAPTSGLFLDAFLLAGYGYLSPGSTTTSVPQSSGVLGNSAFSDFAAGGTAVLGSDSEGPVLSLSTAAVVSSHSVIGTQDTFLRRDQKLRARIKFQVTSVAHTDERFFAGLTTNLALQIGSDDPVGNEYVGLRKSLAGISFEFVARGSGGALVPISAWPIDTAVHYLDLDCTDVNQVRFILYGADGVTVQATTTVLTGTTLPTTTTGMTLACGIATAAGAVRSADFYSATVVTRGDLLAEILGGGSGIPSTLSQTLLLGNTTGASNIVVSSGQGVFGETDLTLSPGVNPGDQVVIDGLRWPSADGSSGTFLRTNGAGVLSFVAVPADTLANVLLAGNTTGATSITVATGQAINGQTNLVLSPGGGGADKVVIDGLSWPTADGASGTFLRTSGAGVLTFAAVPADTLATTLAAGNSTGATSITVTTGQAINGQTNLTLSPGVGVSDKVVIDGLSWPTADGSSGTFLRTDGAGNLSFLSVPAPNLTSVLAAGTATGANSIVVTTGQSIFGQTNLFLYPNATPGNKVYLDGLGWPEADGASGTFLRTNGAGTLSFVAVPADTLATTLAAGNSTGATDLVITTGQKIICSTSGLLLSGAQVTGSGTPATLSLGRNAADVGGPLTLAAGNGASADAGGDVTIQAGSGGATNGAGGTLTILGGAKGGTGSAGTVSIVSGNTSFPTTLAQISGAAQGVGQIQIVANNASSQGGAGLILGRGGELGATIAGYGFLMGGTGSGGGTTGGQAGVLAGPGITGGGVSIFGGQGTNGSGGTTTIRGGTGFTNGGFLSLKGGDASAGGGGGAGSVLVAPGAPDGAGSAGVVQIGPNSGSAGGTRINGTIQNDGTGFVAGSVSLTGVALSSTVNFATTFASTPSVIVTPIHGASATATSYWADTVSTAGFTLRRNATTDGAIPVHWLAVAR